MVKTTWGLSVWACAVVIAVSASVALVGSTAKAQNGWGDDASSDGVNAKKTPPPPPPPPLQIAGPWTGTIQDSHQGAGTINLTLTEKKGSKTKSTLKGNWSITFPPAAPLGAFTDTGTQAGSVTATAVALTFTAKKPDKLAPCKLIFSSVSATLEQITGTYRVSGCKTGNTGTMTLTPGPVPTTVDVDVKDDVFSPVTLTISKGQTVKWTNKGGEPHTVTANPGPEKCGPSSSEAFESSTMNPGDVFNHTFNATGTFAYHCEVHGCPMKGTITVN
jgi:plastocyanin